MPDYDAIVAEIPHLRRYARALIGHRDGADDLVQDTLETAVAKWRLWHLGRPLRPWLLSIMHNRHMDDLRRAKKVDYRAAEALPEMVQPSTASDPLAVRDLDRALAALPLEQREILLLIGLEELSYAQAAKVLNVAQGTVMSRLARGRVRLRALLAGEHAVDLKVVK